MTTLVIGCTGTVGKHVANELAGRSMNVRCMTRSLDKLHYLQAGIEGCAADLDKPETLAQALEGIDDLFLAVQVSPNETRRALAVVEAAKNAGVKKIVYLSVHMPEGSTVIPHFANKVPVENAIQASGIAYTILRPNNFFQNDLTLRDIIVQYGLFPTPIGPVGLNRVDARDIAECAANALTKPGFEGQTYSIHGPDTLTGKGVAAVYSRVLEKEVHYGGNDLDVWAQRSRNVMPVWKISDYRVMYRYYQDHGMIASTAELEREQTLLGHKPRSFENFVEETAREWRIPEEVRAA